MTRSEDLLKSLVGGCRRLRLRCTYLVRTEIPMTVLFHMYMYMYIATYGLDKIRLEAATRARDRRSLHALGAPCASAVAYW